jgi:hypothetical protein
MYRSSIGDNRDIVFRHRVAGVKQRLAPSGPRCGKRAYRLPGEAACPMLAALAMTPFCRVLSFADDFSDYPDRLQPLIDRLQALVRETSP